MPRVRWESLGQERVLSSWAPGVCEVYETFMYCCRVGGGRQGGLEFWDQHADVPWALT